MSKDSLLKETISKGMRVRYQPEHYGEDRWENGIVKEVLENTKAVRVVYNCGGEWERYEEFTSALTNISDLRKGWK